MRKLILKMHTSLDGFVTGPNNDMSWMQPDDDEQWADLFDMLQHVDLFLLGAGMWEEYRDYWKKALTGKGFSADEVKYANFAEKTQHIIFSSSIKDTGWQNASIENGNLLQKVTQLKAAAGKDIQIVGGAAFAAAMIDTGLVDQYKIMVNPVIVGKGKSFFHHLNTRHILKQEQTKSLKNGVVILNCSQLDSKDAGSVQAEK